MQMSCCAYRKNQKACMASRCVCCVLSNSKLLAGSLNASLARSRSGAHRCESAQLVISEDLGTFLLGNEERTVLYDL